MKKNLYLLPMLSMAIIALLASCQLDNYEEPDGTLTGSIIDNVTGKPIITEQPDGFRMRLEEISWSENPIPQYFWGMADGTYNNKRLFAATYTVTPIEGAFVTPNPQTVEVRSKQTTTANFNVMPYISFSNVSIVKEGAIVKATFTLTKNVAASNSRDYRVFVHNKSPLVGVNTFVTEFSSPEQEFTNEDFDVPQVVELTSLSAGETYYIRIGARSDNATGRYNFTEVISIQM